MDPVEIRHLPHHLQFEAVVEGRACRLDYMLEDGRMVIVHTEVPAAVAGRGIAGQLVRAAVLWAREQGLRVVPRCSYAEAYFGRHREFGDILDPH